MDYLKADHVTEFRVMDYKGDIHTVNANEKSDLFSISTPKTPVPSTCTSKRAAPASAPPGVPGAPPGVPGGGSATGGTCVGGSSGGPACGSSERRNRWSRSLRGREHSEREQQGHRRGWMDRGLGPYTSALIVGSFLIVSSTPQSARGLRTA